MKAEQQVFVEIVAAIEPKPADPLDVYLIVAWWSGGWAHWKVFNCLYSSREAAELEAKRLASGWTHVRVVRICDETLAEKAIARREIGVGRA
jgi:hypothetical protein